MIFKTPKYSPIDVSIVGIGYCPSYGAGGVSVENAAQKMPELQDAQGRPLEGKALERAAKSWARQRGLVVELDKEPTQQEEAPVVEKPKSAVAEEEVSE